MNDRRYELFGEVFEVDRALPFVESDSGGSESEAHRVERHGELEEAVDLEALGALRGGGCAIQYGGWLWALRPGDRYIWYRRRVLGDLDLPFAHVAERLIFPIYATLVDDARLAVHGSAVVVDGRAWVVTGDTGAGKSTTGYELMHRFGAELAADEAAVVDVERGRLVAGAPYVRLDRGAGGLEEALEEGPVHPQLDKRWYRLAPDGLAAPGGHPLAGIVYLAPDADREAGEVEWGRMRGSESLTRVVDQCFDFERAPSAWRRRRFSNAAALVDGTGVLRCRFGLSEDGSPSHVGQVWRRLSREAS